MVKLEMEVAGLPKRVAAIEAKLAEHKAAVEKAKAQIKGNETTRRQMEADIKGFQEKIAKYRSQSSSVKTNDEYRALMHEVEFAEKQISGCEDKILELMIGLENEEKALKVAEAELKTESADVEKEKLGVALAASVCGYAVMTLTMSATPLAMLACDHSVTDATLGLQWHVLAMYIPSFFTGTLIHVADIGGMSAGGLPANATEIYHEGLVLPPMKFHEAGVPNQTLLTVLAANSRIPDKLMGDLRALLGGVNVGANRLGALIAKYGLDRLQAIIDGPRTNVTSRAVRTAPPPYRPPV